MNTHRIWFITQSQLLFIAIHLHVSFIMYRLLSCLIKTDNTLISDIYIFIDMMSEMVTRR
jgi:competence protein ComGF